MAGAIAQMPDSPSARSFEPSSANSPFHVEGLKSQFAEQGYLLLSNVISRSELTTVNERLEEEFARWKASTSSFRGGGLMSGHLNCYPGELVRGVMNELREKGVLSLAQSLLPTDPMATRLGCNFNLPGSVVQHYHMDGIFLEHFLILNVAVVDTDLRNGAIDVIPQTHKRFYKYWEFAARGVYRGTTRLPMSQGDILLRTSTLWHRGMPNRSDRPRPMLAITLGEKGVSTNDPFAHANGRVEFQTNWFTTSLLGRLRERTTVVAPITYSAYRFARSLVGNKGYASF
jgi:Phytanoyl-CoA dioxygenase (PhyH)